MPFRFEPLEIPDVILIESKFFKDERGFFKETYKKSEFVKAGVKQNFVQDNHSFSQKDTLRGLHFQNPPHSQGKLVRCVSGSILDVAVDIRLSSPTFGKWISAELNDKNHLMLWIPEGFAHGFLALEDSHVEYKVTNEYHKESEDGIIWNDPTLNILWNISHPIVSEKDSGWPLLKEDKLRFVYQEEM